MKKERKKKIFNIQKIWISNIQYLQEDSQPWPGLRHHCSSFPTLVSCELLRVPRTGVCG